MSLILPVDLSQILHPSGAIESSRVEFKASWDEKTTGAQILRTICAFANDIQNLNGGYIVLGVEEANGVAVLPPKGLPAEEIDTIQSWIRGKCKGLIVPEYVPVLSPEVIDGKHILVIWAPGGELRPYQSPESIERAAFRHYYVRTNSQTTQASGTVLTNLMQQTAKVPFDDRRALDVPLEKLRESLVREFLADIRSGLLQESDGREIYRKMFLSARVNGHEVPRNVGLLFFSDDPVEWFRGAKIEIVEFTDDGDKLAENEFRGPIHHQIRAALRHLKNMSVRHLEKQQNTPEVKGWVSYPLPALEEALVNAVYHRSYENTEESVEPTKIYLYPNRIEVISYPGPHPGLKMEHLQKGASVPRLPARNRRIGELLKEVRLAEARGTGIPKVFRSMRQNGSPEPRFEFDEQRSYFRVTLPVHPEYLTIFVLRDVAHLRAIGDRAGASRRLRDAFDANPGSGVIAYELIQEFAHQGEIGQARSVYERFFSTPTRVAEGRVVMAMSTAYFDASMNEDARDVLNRLPTLLSPTEAIDAAILERRAGHEDRAHRLFHEAGDALQLDARALLEFAQTKIKLATDISKRRRQSTYDKEAHRRLLREARNMLQRVLQLDTARTRHAWASYELGRVLRWLQAPASEIRQAFEQAATLAPNETRFQDELAKLNK